MGITSKGFDFGRLFGFPYKDKKVFEKILIGWAISLAGMIIPILPAIILFGYQYRLMAKDIEDGELVMPEWDDFGGLIKDGFKVFAANLIFNLPTLIMAGIVLLINLLPVVLVVIFSIQENIEAMMSATFATIPLFLVGFIISMVMVVIQWVTVFFLYPAMGELVAQEKFSGAFDFKAWWPILRKNFVGYLLAIVLTIPLGLVAGLVAQVLMFTVIGIIALPAVTFLTQVYSYAIIAEAYIGGQALRKASEAETEQIESQV